MAFGSASGIFRQFLADTLGLTAATFDLHNPSDTYKVALYGNTGTPDKDNTAVQAAYNGTGGPWVTANEVVSSTTGWSAGGVVMTSATMVISTPSSGVVRFAAANVASGASATIAAAYGSLCYDDSKTTPVPDQAVCFNSFGGSNGVTNGTLTIVWNANGLFQITV